jgi:hypothetical protein
MQKIATARARVPSILPAERFFEGLRLVASIIDHYGSVGDADYRQRCVVCEKEFGISHSPPHVITEPPMKC